MIAREIAGLLKVKRTFILQRAKRENWQFTLKSGNGGQIKDFLIDSLPSDIQKKIFNAHPVIAMPMSRQKQSQSFDLSPVLAENKALVETAQGKVLPLKKATSQQSSRVTALSVIPEVLNRESIKLPQWSEKQSLARYDLVMSIRDRKKQAKKSGQSKTKMARESLKLYNEGFLFQEIFKTLSKVKLNTYYEWDKKLKRASNDYHALAPQWGKNRGEFSLLDIEKEVFLRVLLSPNHLSVGSATRIVKAIINEKGFASNSSYATFRRFATAYKRDNYNIWVLTREGEKALDDKVLPYIERDRTLINVGDVLVADGHTLNFNIVNPFTGKPCRATLLMFFDWRSAMPCGFEIMLTEDIQCIQSAFRKAIINLGKIPANVLIDNGKAFKSKVFISEIDFEQAGIQGLYGRLGVNVRFSAAYNAKDKPIERFFKTFSEWIERMMPSYCGSSIEDKPAYMMRNEKWHKAHHNPVIPSVEEAIKLVQAGLDFYSSQPHSGLKNKTPLEVFSAGKGSGININDLNHLMMSMEIKTLYRNGIRFFGSHYFNEALVGLKDRVIIKYDIQDLRHILVYGIDGEFLGKAERTYKFDPLMRGKDDLAHLKHRQTLRRQIKQQSKKLVRAIHGIPEIPELNWQKTIDIVPDLPEVMERAIEESSNFPVIPAVTPSVIPEVLNRESIPQFNEAWQRYEYLLSKTALAQEEKDWITAYTNGLIFEGEWESIYGSSQSAIGGQI